MRRVVQRHYDFGRGVEFTTAIADAEGIEVGLPPLYDVVDAAPLENTFFGTETTRTSRRGNGAVALRYDGLVVEVETTAGFASTNRLRTTEG